MQVTRKTKKYFERVIFNGLKVSTKSFFKPIRNKDNDGELVGPANNQDATEELKDKKCNRRNAKQIIFICLATGQMIFYKRLVRKIGSNWSVNVKALK